MTSLFDGPGLNADVDDPRLLRQIERVWLVVRDGTWRTLGQIAHDVDAPEASVSARLRDLRKPWWGGHEVEERRTAAASGLHEYRVIAQPCGLLDGTQAPHDAVAWRECDPIRFCVEHQDFHPPRPTRINHDDSTTAFGCDPASWRRVRVHCEPGLWA